MRKAAAVAGIAAILASTGLASIVRAQQVTGVTPAPSDPTVVIKGEKKVRKPTDWFRAESQHFVVYSDARQADVQALLSKLERFRYTLRSFTKLPTDKDESGPKLELYYMAHEQNLDTADPSAPEFSIGLYKSCEEGVQAYGVHMYYQPNPKAVLEKQPENEGLSYIFEAYARHFFYQNSYERTPTWFIDGFAHYFSTARFDGNQAVVGLAPEPFGIYLQRMGSEMRYSLDYKDILEQNETSGNNYIGVAGVRNEFQVRAWILTHYILSSKENRARFHAYTEALARGEKPVPAFEKAFGFTASHASYVLWKYMHSNLTAMKLDFKALPEAEVSFETLPPSAEKLLMWQSALKACPTAKYGAKLLSDIRTEAAKYPESELAHMTLSRAEILYGDAQGTLPYLSGVAADSPNDFDAQYLLGRAELTVAQKASGTARKAAFDAATTAFSKASIVDPQSPANAYFFYRTQILSHDAPSEDAMGAALVAWEQAPEVDAYALAAGLTYAHIGRKDDALQALHSVADNPRGRSLAPVAKTWIDRIMAGVSDADIVAGMKEEHPAPEGGVDEWTMASGDIWKAVWQAVEAEETADVLDAQAQDSGQTVPNR